MVVKEEKMPIERMARERAVHWNIACTEYGVQSLLPGRESDGEMRNQKKVCQKEFLLKTADANVVLLEKSRTSQRKSHDRYI